MDSYIQTTTAVRKEKINESVFPLYFSIILKSAFNITVLESHGYTAMYKFFSGEKGHDRDKKLFDWRGKQNITIQSIQFYFRFMLNGF